MPSARAPWITGASQPFNRVVWPSESVTYWPGGGLNPYDAMSALRVPAVTRATQLYAGLIKQCPMDAFRGIQVLERPRLLDRPDPTDTRSRFVALQVEDYLWHGNALSLITRRNAEGWPAAVSWLPASWTSVTWTPGDARPKYWVGGRELPYDDVVHVRRSADRFNPSRGIGVIEQHAGTIDRMALEEEYERASLLSSGVPSVVIIAPNPDLSQEAADDGKAKWLEKYGGPVREPAILPYGTTVQALGWSPEDSQMIEARQMSLIDVANAFNLDAYWLNGQAQGLTYKSVAPLYVALLRTSLESVLVDLEQTWADRWLPAGQSVRFDRLQLTRDDFATTITTLSEAIAAGIFTTEQAWQYLGLGAGIAPPASILSPVATTPEGIE